MQRTDLPAIERRIIAAPVELRMEGEGDAVKKTLFGYAAKFNVRTLLYSWSDEEWYEEIDPGFFSDVLEDDCKCLKNHDPNLILGRNGSTLTLKTDKIGLHFECTPDTRITYAADTMYAVERGDINQCSFAFSIASQSWFEEKVGEKLIVTRKLLKAKRLYDVGCVTYPAYPDTEAGVRSDDFAKGLEEYRSAKREAERPIEESTGEVTHPEYLKRQRALRLLELE